MAAAPQARALLLSVLSLAAPSLAAPPSPISLDALLAPPFPAELVAAPTGGLVAWVQKAAGARNVWVAGPPEYRGRQLTSYAADDGQELGDLAITPDGGTVLYVRGASPNRRGENPNPASDPAGAEQVVWRVAVEGGEPVRIGAGAAPAISPRGDLVAYVQGGQIWSAPLDEARKLSCRSNGEGAPAQLVKARGTLRTLRWSPDGARLAFVSTRGDHAFVGVYDLAGKSVRWLAPSVDRDDEPVWSPDGARIAFLRVPASSRMTLFRAVREARPWSIQVAEAATGAVREVWRADEGRGAPSKGSSPTRSSSGRPATASSSPGRRPGGCCSTRCRRAAARRPC